MRLVNGLPGRGVGALLASDDAALLGVVLLAAAWLGGVFLI